jgi:hypothetical protein
MPWERSFWVLSGMVRLPWRKNIIGTVYGMAGDYHQPIK